MGGRSRAEAGPDTPHSAFPIPHWAGRGRAVKIAVVFDTLHPDWEDAEYKKEIEAKVEEAEYDVARALLAQEHDVLMVGVADQLAPVLERLAAFQPKLVFNGCESFRGHARHEYALATVLEMHGYRYTGSSPTGLLVARNKSLTKKILAHHEIRVPAFAEFRPEEKPVRPSEASSNSGFTMSGKRSSDGRTGFSPGRNSANAGTRISWCARIFLVSDLLRATSSPVGDDPV